MKTIVRILSLFIMSTLIFTACSEDDIAPITEPSDIRLINTGNNSVVLNVNEPEGKALELIWDDFSGGEGEYTIEMSRQENFAEPFVIGKSTERRFSVSNQALNTVLINQNYMPYTSFPGYVRIVKGNEKSNSLQFRIKTYPTAQPMVTLPEMGGTMDLAHEEKEETIAFSWKDYRFGEGAVVSYTVEIAKAGTQFANPVLVGTTDKTTLEVVKDALNTQLIKAGFEESSTTDAEIRVKSVVSAPTGETLTFMSPVVEFKIKTTELSQPRLYLVGAVQQHYGVPAWTPMQAIELRYIGEDNQPVFEGYFKIGANDEFKFISSQDDWGDLEGNYGLGNEEGTLENGSNTNIKANGEGFYYVRVDLSNPNKLTYKLVKMQWGIIGNATPNSWNGETPMTYDFATNTFKWSGNLVKGELKFRSGNTGQAIYGNEWKFNVGDDNVAYDTGSGNIAIEAGNYTLGLKIQPQGQAKATGF